MLPGQRPRRSEPEAESRREREPEQARAWQRTRCTDLMLSDVQQALPVVRLRNRLGH